MILEKSVIHLILTSFSARWAVFGYDSLEGSTVMIPKYRQNNHEQMVLGARFAQDETENHAGTLVDWYPSRLNSKDDQIMMVQNATMQRAKAIMMANNAGREIEDYALEARESGITVVTYDSPLKGGLSAGESFFVAPVDFDFTGVLMADMALDILGFGGGDFAILSTTPHASNQNAWIEAMKKAITEDEKYQRLNLVGVFWPVIDNAQGYMDMTLELVALRKNGTYPNLSLIMAPTTSGSAASARALLENGYCDIMKVSGLSVPAEMLEVSQSGCAPEFALWNNLDLGYLAYFATHALLTGNIEGKEKEIIKAGRLNQRIIEKDPTRENGLRVLLGDFILYNSENVERAAFVDCIMGFCGESEDYFEERFMEKYQKKALAIIPKVTGMISFTFSGFLVQHILRNKKRRKQTFQRIILGMSASDMFSSFFGFFLSTWPMPQDTWLAYGATGTKATCSMQGFFFQLGICATPLYNSGLALFYVMKIVWHWDEERIKGFEPIFHFVPISIALATAIAGLFLELYNPASRGYMCWIEEYPPYCGNSLSCERGEEAAKYRWGFLYGFVVAVFLWLTFAMMMVFNQIYKHERGLDRYRAEGAPVDRRRSRQVANQALLYVLAFALPWIWGLIISSIDTAQNIFESGVHDNAITALNMVNAFIFPLQGFFNFLVYARPRYMKIKKKYPEMNFIQVVAKVLAPRLEHEGSNSVFRTSIQQFFRNSIFSSSSRGSFNMGNRSSDQISSLPSRKSSGIENQEDNSLHVT